MWFGSKGYNIFIAFSDLTYTQTHTIGEHLMMKLITILFITAGWIVSLIPMMILSISYLADNSIGVALCFFAIILFITGQFYDLLRQEL